MSKIPVIAFFNGKGGCGKTTGIINVAGELSCRHEKVLVIDMDKQHNATDTLLTDEQSEYSDKSKTLYDVFQGKATLEEVVKKSYLIELGKRNASYCNIDVIPSDTRFENEHEIESMQVELKEAFAKFIESNNYTYVLIDMPPSNAALNKICFSQMANNVIVPFSPDIYSIRGYSDTMDIINRARAINDDLNIIGIYVSRVRSSNIEIYEALKSFGKMFIDVQIPLSAQIERTINESRPIAFSKKKGKALEAYKQLVDCIMERI